MKYPQWLQYAQLENEADETNVANIQLEDPPANMETFPALQLAFDCAKTTLLADTGFSALADSFDEPIERVDVHAALNETKVYVAKWLRAARDAFHVPAHNKPESVVVGNVFVKLDVSWSYHQSIITLPLPCAHCSSIVSQSGRSLFSPQGYSVSMEHCRAIEGRPSCVVPHTRAIPCGWFGFGLPEKDYGSGDAEEGHCFCG